MPKDLGVDISKKNTNIGKAVLEVRHEAQQHGEEVEGFVTLLLQHCGYKSSRKTASSKSRQSLESRTRQILEPNTSTEDQSDEHWRDVIATFVQEGLESHWMEECFWIESGESGESRSG